MPEDLRDHGQAKQGNPGVARISAGMLAGDQDGDPEKKGSRTVANRGIGKERKFFSEVSPDHQVEGDEKGAGQSQAVSESGFEAQAETLSAKNESPDQAKGASQPERSICCFANGQGTDDPNPDGDGVDQDYAVGDGGVIERTDPGPEMQGEEKTCQRAGSLFPLGQTEDFLPGLGQGKGSQD